MRNAFRLFVVVLVPFCLTACSSASSSSTPVPAKNGGGGATAGFDQTKLETVIPEMIRLLEAKEYKTALTTFSTAETLKEMTNGKPIDEAVKELDFLFPMMLEGLKKAKDMKPTMENDGKLASYKLSDKPGSSETLSFVKVDGKWYAGKK